MKKLIPDFSTMSCFIILLLILPSMCIAQNNTSAKITLLSYNSWLGGTQVSDGQSKTLNAILMSGADIVGISEATNDIGNFLADRLGWYRYVTTDNDIISRFPIKKTWSSLRGAGAEIEIENGKIIVLKAAHLNYTPYGPYRACLDGASVSQIINEETTSGRMGEIISALNSIDTYLKDGTPTFLMGDFNVPSHLDWIESTADEHCGYIIEWPVTKAIEDSGMTDSYREAYPDPKAFPAITWSPVYKTFVHDNGKPEPLDRIDFIYYAGDSVKMLGSEIFIIGTPEQIPNQWQNEWPSDHAAVISRFSVETGAAVNNIPVAKFFADTSVVIHGDNVAFTDISSNNPTSWSWIFEGGTPATSSDQNPVVTYENNGNYNVTLISSNAGGSDTTTVTDLIVVKPATDQVNISTYHLNYNPDESISVSFKNGAGNPTDWIGIYKAGDVPGQVHSTLWNYVNNTQTAGEGITEGIITFPSGLHTEGNYWVGFFENDGYHLLAADSFEVKEGQPRLKLNKNQYEIGESITAAFSNGPNNSTDWIGIYKVGDIPGPVPSTVWYYVNGTQTATVGITSGSVIFDGGLADKGIWWAGFFENDGYTLLDSTGFSVSNLTAVEGSDNLPNIPAELNLQIYPNPFNPATRITYSIPRSEKVTIKVYDAMGNAIATLLNEIKVQGNYELDFDGTNLASGVYMCTIETGNETVTKKMMLMK